MKFFPLSLCVGGLLLAGCTPKPDLRVAADDAAIQVLIQDVAHLKVEIGTLQSLASLQVDQITNINARIRLAEDTADALQKQVDTIYTGLDLIRSNQISLMSRRR